MLNKQAGVTLVELILSIIIISIVLVSIINLIVHTTKHSADPLIQQQAIAIAESYIEEITALPITDPDGDNTGESRSTFDNVDDYHQLLDNGVVNQAGEAVALLSSYQVEVNISLDELETVSNIRVITVTVTPPANMPAVSLTAYRAPYN
ncbi:MAG TPA: pilus assembly protein MshD [Gammaproteobacteria bacterium]|nr:pilus assembly protein MshD [Gammaproteobacteria bacterium]